MELEVVQRRATKMIMGLELLPNKGCNIGGGYFSVEKGEEI